MDARHFDALARRLGSRRTALGGLLAGLVLPLEAAARGKKGKQRKGRGKGKNNGKNQGGDKHKQRNRKSKDKAEKRTKAQTEPCWRSGACILKKGANVSRCDLAGYTAPTGLDCTGCNASRANLRGANLSGANLTKANLSGACLIDANLSGATFANTTNLVNAIFCNTTMPNGSVNNGGCQGGTACCPICDAAHPCASGCCNAGLCGTCSGLHTCGGGGTPGVCGCTPTTCAAQSAACGEIPDGCGETLSCGTCANPTPICGSNTCMACSNDGQCGAGEHCCGGSCLQKTWTNQTTFGGSRGPGPDQFHEAWSVTVSSDGLTAWIADQTNHRISIWTRPDASSTAWDDLTTFGPGGIGSEQFRFPTSVSVSPDGLTAWYADRGNDHVSIWRRPNSSSTAWENVTTFGSNGSGSDRFSDPWSVAVSPDGLTAWVADRGNDRISIWRRPDASSTAWENLTTFGSSGSGLNQFLDPTGIAVSSDGLTAWVADRDNDRIAIWGLACPA